MPPGSRGTSTGNDSGGGNTGGASAGGLGGNGGGGGGLSGAVQGAINAANSAVGLSGIAGAGSGQPQMDAATRARISNIQKNATHEFMGQLDDANNTDDPAGQIGAALAGMIGLHEMAPQPGQTFDGSTYDTDPRASWSFDPVRLGASVLGGVTGIPGLSYLGGKLSDSIGNPGSVNLGKDVFGGSPSAAASPAMAGTGGVATTAATPTGAGIDSGGGSQGQQTPSPTDTPEERQRKLAMRSEGAKLFGLPGYADGGTVAVPRSVVAAVMQMLGNHGAGGGVGMPAQQPQMSKMQMLAAQYQQKNGMPGMGAPQQMGGAPMPDPGMPPRPDGQFLEGPGNGRSDSIQANVADGEYIVPADVVSALGNGSSKAGSRALGAMVGNTRKDYRNHIAELPKPQK